MAWMDSKLWEKGREFGNEALKDLATHFEVTLVKAKFDKEKLLPEWRRFKIFVKVNFEYKLINDEVNARTIWKQVLQYRSKEFPNLCLLAQIVLSITSSNAATERAFNILTLLLTDRRTSLKHDITAKLMFICTNDHLWDEEERSSILENAVNIHLEKIRRKAIDLPPQRKRKFNEIIKQNTSDEEDSEEDDDEYSGKDVEESDEGADEL